MDRDIRRSLAHKYNGMKQRCYNPKNSEYKNYGARGIGICEEWLSNPDSFFEWGVLNGYEKGLTIDRIDVNSGYEPKNCRWATMAEQQSNKRSNVMVECNGEMVTLAEASRRIGVSESAVWMRVKRGIPVDRKPYKWEKPVVRDDGVVFQSVKDAAKSVGVNDTKVSAVCNGNRKTTGGHSFRFLTREEAEAALAGKDIIPCKHGLSKHRNEIGEDEVYCELNAKWMNVTLGDCLGNCESEAALAQKGGDG